MENKNTDLEFNIEEVKEVVALHENEVTQGSDHLNTVSFSRRAFCC